MVSTGLIITELAVSLAKRGWVVEVLALQPMGLVDGRITEPTPRKMVYEGVTVRRPPPFNLRTIFRWPFFVIYCAWHALRGAGRFDGLVVTTNPPFVGIVGWLLKLVRRKPYVVIVHDINPDMIIRNKRLRANSPVAWLWERINRIIFREAGANIVLGRDMARIIAAKLQQDHPPMPVIPNWSDEQSVRHMPKHLNPFRAEHVPPGVFLVQYAGTMSFLHNVEPLLEAAEILKHEPVFFQFIGEGDKKDRMQKLAAEKRLGNTQFLPFQPKKRLGEVLSAPDLSVVCLASEMTGYAVPCKSYGVMGAGVPILALMDAESEIGLTVKEAGCGVVIPAATGAKVAEAIRELARQPEKVEEMGRRGYQAFQSHHTLSRATTAYEAAFREAFDIKAE